MKNKVRPIYEELQGYLSQTPLPDKQPYLNNARIGDNLNSTIDELNQITKRNYDKFKIHIRRETNFTGSNTGEYRMCLNGLINKLHAEFFGGEVPPFSGSPSMVVKQSQQQTQSVQIKMIMDFQTIIDQKLYGGSDLKEKENTFLQKLKDKLPAISSMAELLSAALSIAKDLGLSIDSVLTLIN